MEKQNKVKKLDFFRKESAQSAPEAPSIDKAPMARAQEDKLRARTINHARRDERLDKHLAAMQSLLAELGLKELEGELQQLIGASAKKTFSIAVVGEFSKGKSTLVNALIRQNLLPTGLLPSTAVLTKLTYHQHPTLVYQGDGSRQKLPLSEEGWKFIGNARTGAERGVVAFVGVEDPWLRDGNYEIVDTPGVNAYASADASAADIALGYADSAIIVLSADAPMSMTEATFLRERHLLHTVPRTMVCITKMDRVPLAERKRVYAYINTRIAEFNLKDVPVFIAANELEMGDAQAQRQVGFSAIRAQLDAWNDSEQHYLLRRDSILAKLESIASRVSNLLGQQLALYGQNEASRAKLIEEKEAVLARMELQWGDIRTETLRRSTEALAIAEKAHNEQKARIVDFLQYEVSHANDPKEWWEQDYPFRLKIQLSTYAVGVENAVKKRYMEDAAWVRETVAGAFKQAMDVRLKSDLAEDSGQMPRKQREVPLSDIKKKRMLTRTAIGLGTIASGGAAAAVAGGAAITILGIGFPAFLLGTGLFGIIGNITAERFLNKSVNEQRQVLKTAVEKDVAQALDSALGKIEPRVIEAYDTLLSQTVNRQMEWVRVQRTAIHETQKGDTKEQAERCKRFLQRVESLRDTYHRERVDQHDAQ